MLPPSEITEFAIQALYLALLLSAPALGVSLMVGLAVGIFQASTQIQDSALGFVPKMVAVLATLMLLAPWIAGEMLSFTQAAWAALP